MSKMQCNVLILSAKIFSKNFKNRFFRAKIQIFQSKKIYIYEIFRNFFFFFMNFCKRNSWKNWKPLAFSRFFQTKEFLPFCSFKLKSKSGKSFRFHNFFQQNNFLNFFRETEVIENLKSGKLLLSRYFTTK